MDIAPIRFRYNVNGQDDVRNAPECCVYHAQVIDDVLHLFTSLTFLPGNYGNITFHQHNYAYFLKNDALWDRYIDKYSFEEIATDINYNMTVQLWENNAASKEREVFDYLKKVCEPAYRISALGYDPETDEIYSEGPDSFIAKTSGITDRVVVVKNMKLGTKYLPMVGGFPGMEQVRLLDSDTMITFMNKFNTVFH